MNTLDRICSTAEARIVPLPGDAVAGDDDVCGVKRDGWVGLRFDDKVLLPDHSGTAQLLLVSDCNNSEGGLKYAQEVRSVG